MTVIMFTAYFPFLTYAVPALAGSFLVIILFEIDRKYALATYLVTAGAVLLLCEEEAKWIYVGFCGYYPILKSLLERVPLRVGEYGLKLLCFNAAITGIYFGIAKVFGLPEDSLETLGRFAVPILYGLANGVFLLYDLCLTRMAGWYAWKWHSRISGIFRR